MDTFLGPIRFQPQQPYGRADWDLIARAFFDAGWTIHSQRQGQFPIQERNETLLGTGVGLEFQFKRNFSARIDWGVALNETDSSGRAVDVGDNEFHLVFTFLY